MESNNIAFILGTATGTAIRYTFFIGLVIILLVYLATKSKELSKEVVFKRPKLLAISLILLVFATVALTVSIKLFTTDNKTQANNNTTTVATESPKELADKEAKEDEVIKANRARLIADAKIDAEMIPYKTLYRNIDSYVGQNHKVHYRGKVIQITGNGILTEMRVNITQDEYGFWTDTVLVNDIPAAFGEHPKILEDDIIDFWGMVQGETSYQSVMGSTISLPSIYATVIELVK